MRKRNSLVRRLAAVALSIGLAAAPAAGNGNTAYASTIQGTSYDTVQAAINAGIGRIVLDKDITENITIPSEKEVTIDLNGFTITNNSSGQEKATVINEGTLTIMDSKGNGKIDNVTHQKAALINRSGGTVTINGGEFLRSKVATDNRYYVIDNQGTMEINNGYVHSSEGWGTGGSSLIRNGGGDTASQLTINGGEFQQDNFIVIKNS